MATSGEAAASPACAATASDSAPAPPPTSPLRILLLAAAVFLAGAFAGRTSSLVGMPPPALLSLSQSFGASTQPLSALAPAPAPAAAAAPRSAYAPRSPARFSPPLAWNATVGPSHRTLKPGVTLILTVFRRGGLLKRQLARIAANTVKPAALWVWQTGEHADVRPILRESYPSAALIQVTGHDFMFHGRYLPALQAETEHVCWLDDDTMPGSLWLETTLAAFEHLGPRDVVGCLGRNGKFVHQWTRNGRNLSAVFLEQFTSVSKGWADFPIHCSCMRTELARAFWILPAYTFANGEDIQAGAALQIVAGSRVFIPEAKGEASGDTDVSFGADKFAAHMRPGHGLIREEILRYWVSLGWWPLLLPRNVSLISEHPSNSTEVSFMPPEAKGSE